MEDSANNNTTSSVMDAKPTPAGKVAPSAPSTSSSRPTSSAHTPSPPLIPQCPPPRLSAQDQAELDRSILAERRWRTGHA
jgi:hypothetical protein